MCSEISGQVDTKEVKSGTIVKTMFASAKLYSKRPEIERLRFTANTAIRVDEQGSQINQSQQSRISNAMEENEDRSKNYLAEGGRKAALSQGSFTIASKPSLDSLRSHNQQKASGTAFFERRPKLLDPNTMPANPISAITANRWSLASSAISRFPIILECQPHFSHPPKDATPGSPDCFHFLPDTLLALSIQNWPMSDLLRSIDGLIVGMILWLASFAYGALHAAAWNDYFPSAAEKWLWRGSAIYISFCGGLWIILNYVARNWPRLNAYWDRWADGQLGWWHYLLLGPLVVVCGSSFMLARVYIVVEAFASVRSLPVDAYQTPQWSQIFPHF